MADLPQLIALLHLASPALPIGGFSYSQGLEAAIQHSLVTDAASAEAWIGEHLTGVVAHTEAPVWLLLHRCWKTGDHAGASRWNEWFLATRETAELRLETEQMGWSLAQLVSRMGWGDAALREALGALKPVCLPTAYAAACAALGADERDGLCAYCFGWAENQIAAALKAVPLGQIAGQHILTRLHGTIQQVAGEAARRADADPPELSTFAPMLGILSARHEVQYSRLFRS